MYASIPSQRHVSIPMSRLSQAMNTVSVLASSGRKNTALFTAMMLASLCMHPFLHCCHCIGRKPLLPLRRKEATECCHCCHCIRRKPLLPLHWKEATAATASEGSHCCHCIGRKPLLPLHWKEATAATALEGSHCCHCIGRKPLLPLHRKKATAATATALPLHWKQWRSQD